MPIISPELSIQEMVKFRNKNFIALVHGKIRLMTLRHKFKEDIIKDERKIRFKIGKIQNGSEILNNKELGLFTKAKQLINNGINKIYIDTDKKVKEIVPLYRRLLDIKKIDDKNIKKNYVLGWSFREVR